jgi:hypothetical protein
LWLQAIDGDYDAQDELGEECDCDPDVFDMLGAMINGDWVPDTALYLTVGRQKVLGERTGAIFFAETDAKRYQLAELFADWMESLLELADAEMDPEATERERQEIVERLDEYDDRLGEEAREEWAEHLWKEPVPEPASKLPATPAQHAAGSQDLSPVFEDLSPVQARVLELKPPATPTRQLHLVDWSPVSASEPEPALASVPELSASAPELLFAPEPEPALASGAISAGPCVLEAEESAMVFSPERRFDAKERRERPPRRYDKSNGSQVKREGRGG